MCSPHLKLEKLWWWSIYINYLTFFCMEGLLYLFFLPLIHLFNLCLYHYWPTNVYFSLWVMIQYDFVYFVAKYLPALNSESPCSWPLCPFEIVTPLYLVSKQLLMKTIWKKKNLQKFPQTKTWFKVYQRVYIGRCKCYAVLYKEFKHLCILVLAGVPGTNLWTLRYGCTLIRVFCFWSVFFTKFSTT